jgi:hypothetical protein
MPRLPSSTGSTAQNRKAGGRAEAGRRCDLHWKRTSTPCPWTAERSPVTVANVGPATVPVDGGVDAGIDLVCLSDGR